MEIKLNVYNRMTLVISRVPAGWEVRRLSTDGKRGLVDNLSIPAHVKAEELENFFEELFHEWATPECPVVMRIE